MKIRSTTRPLIPTVVLSVMTVSIVGGELYDRYVAPPVRGFAKNERQKTDREMYDAIHSGMPPAQVSSIIAGFQGAPPRVKTEIDNGQISQTIVWKNTDGVSMRFDFRNGKLIGKALAVTH